MMDENPYRAPLTRGEPGPGKPKAAFWPQLYRIGLLLIASPIGFLASLWLLSAIMRRDIVGFSIGCAMGAIAGALIYLFRQIRL